MVSKAKQRKQIKLEMLRYCQLWKFTEELTIAYFKQKGYKLSHTHFYELKTELDDDKTTMQWFNDMALKVMEKDHMIDYQSINELQSVLMQEVQQLNLTNVYIKDPKNKDALILNPQHDSNTLSRIVATIDQLTKSKSDMLAANPVVQAMLLKKRQDEDKAKQLEENALKTK